MTDPNDGRPRQVTLAGWLLMAGSVLVVALVFQRLAGLHTLESRVAVEKFLAEPPGSALGTDVDSVITLIRTLAMVTAGCATAAGILGYQVLRRSRSARTAVTVLAVPLFLAGMVTGGFLSSVVAASAVILWMQPARSWFDGTTPPDPRAVRAAVPAAPPSASAAPTWPPPVAPPAAGVWPPPHPAACDRRPGAVLWACVLTWVFTGLTMVGLVASAVALAVDRDELLDQIHRDNPQLRAQGVSDDLLVAGTYVLIAGVLLWCVGVAGVAVLTFRRVAWARIVLVVSAAVCGVLCLLGTVAGGFLLVVPLMAALLTLGLLLRPDTAPWFERPSGAGPPSPAGAAPPR